MIRRIVSGGQTGVDRAALDCALELGIAHGGWIPLGRRAEDGALPDRYDGLRETESPEYGIRTALNVQDSDATLIISHGPLDGGSLFTREVATREGKPCLHVDLDRLSLEAAVAEIERFLVAEDVGTLNVAGPRASKDPEIGRQAFALLHRALS